MKSVNKSIIKVDFLKTYYKAYFLERTICIQLNILYLCTVFFIVLDLRLTKVGVQRYSFFMSVLYGYFDE